MQIKIENRDIQIPYLSVVAIQYDNNTQVIDFTIERAFLEEDLSLLTPLILYKNRNGSFIDQLEKTVTDPSIICRWKIDKHITNVSGDLSFMVVFASCEDFTQYKESDKIWSTKISTCTIPETIIANGVDPGDSTPPMIAKLISVAAQASEIIQNSEAFINTVMELKRNIDVSQSELETIKKEAIGYANQAKETIENFGAEDVTFSDGKTFQEKLNEGLLNGPKGDTPILTISEQGFWVIDGVTTTTKATGEDGQTPTITIDPRTKHWLINGTDLNISAEGTNGVTPSIGSNNHWFIGETDTGVLAIGQDGTTPTIEINTGGFWVINGTTTTVKAAGADGTTPAFSIGKTTTLGSGFEATATNTGIAPDIVLNFGIPRGADGHSPVITIQEGIWFIDGVTTNVKAEGKDGSGLSILGTLESIVNLPATGNPGDAYMIGGDLYVWTTADSQWINVGHIKGDKGDQGYTPTVGDNGNWFINGVDTGHSSRGTVPSIGANGNWFFGDVDTGFPSKGSDGHTPIITIGENGNWFVDDVDTFNKAQGEQGPPGEGVTEMQSALDLKQSKEDSSLQTTSKTVIGAINELASAYISDLQTFLNVMNGTGGVA